MRRYGLLALAAVALFAAPSADAATCHITTGDSYLWSAIGTLTTSAGGAATWGTCTPTGVDTVVIDSGANVTITGTIAFSTGGIQVDGGTLSQPGTAITFSGVTTGGIDIISGTYRPQGAVIWEGRISSDVTYSGTFGAGPQTAAFTIPLASISGIGIVNTTDYVVVGDDDPTSLDNPIRQPVQTTNGPPIPGYHRPSLMAGAWLKVNTAPATSTLTVYTNAFTDAESLAPADDAYDGTRGPAVPTATAITGAPARVADDLGMVSAITYDDSITDVVRVDNDLMGQYVEFMTGDCAGDMPSKIAFTRDDDGAGGADLVYVWGDVSQCGSGVDTKIHYGLRNGDHIRIVRPASVSGTVANAGPTIFWHGGKLQADFTRFTYLDWATSYGGDNMAMHCLLCIFRDGTNTINFADSYLTNSQFAYDRMGLADIATVGFLGANSVFSAYLHGTGPIDATGFKFDGVNVADQAFNDTDTAAVSQHGNHGVVVESATGLVVDRMRVERTGDDGIIGIADSYSDTAPQVLTVRRSTVFENYDTTDASNSAQCLEYTADSSSATEALVNNVVVKDFFAFGCPDDDILVTSLGSTFDRIVASGSAFNAGNKFGGGGGYSALPAGASATYPTYVRNALIAQYSDAAASMNATMGAHLEHSIVIGNGLNTGSLPGFDGLVSATNSLLETGGLTGPPLRRLASSPASRVPTITLRDFVLLNPISTANMRYLGDTSFDDNSVFTAFNLERVFIGLERTNTNGILGNAAGTTFITGNDTTQPVTVNGATISVVTQTTGGFGRGGSNEGTAQGANVTNTCIESTSAIGRTLMLGAAAGSSNLTVGNMLPESDDDHNLRDFVVQKGSEESVCMGLARPRQVGLTEFGVAHGRLGGGFVKSLISGNGGATTDDSLIQLIGGGGGGSSGRNR